MVVMPWVGGHALCCGSHGDDHHALDHHCTSSLVVMVGCKASEQGGVAQHSKIMFYNYGHLLHMISTYSACT